MDDYQHEHSAMNGFDNATLTIRGEWKWVENWWFEGIGRDIQVFNPDLNTVWRGFVNSLSVSIGPLSASRGPLVDIGNYAYVVYSRILDDSVTPPVVGDSTLTTAAQDTDSIAQYGQWEKVLSGGTCIPGTAERYRDTYIEEYRLPISSEELNLDSGQEVQLRISCLGYWAWLKAYLYSDATASTVTITTKLQNILAADTNGIFSSDYSYIDANAYLATREESDNPTAYSVVMATVPIGDVNDNRYTFGVWEDQIARYREITTLAPAYEHFLTDDKVRVAGYGGGNEVEYWDVRADEWLFAGDFLEGQVPDTVDRRQDDRFIFAERVRYSIPDRLSINGMKISTLPQFMAKMGMGGAV